MKKNLALIIEALIWLLVIIIVVMGCFLYKKNNLKHKHSYHVFFTDANGLKTGSPVKIMGNEIGYVTNVSVVSNNDVFVSFVITNHDIVLPAGVTANIELTGLVGSRSLELYPPAPNNNKTTALVSAKDSNRVQGAYSNSTQTSEILYNAAYNANKSIPVNQIPVFRNTIRKTAKDVLTVPILLENIHTKEDSTIHKVKNNQKLKKFNQKLEELAK